MGEPLLLGVDVGTGSVRAGLFTTDGARVGFGEESIQTRVVRANFFEQSSVDIWEAVVSCVREACYSCHEKDAASRVVALGFDATCSLVVVDEETFEPLSITGDDPTGEELDAPWNIILWLDHRGIGEASTINASKEPAVQEVLRQFGNSISPENEPPKLMWLKKNLPHCIERGIFFDLADWLAFRCTNDPEVRSSCTLACKWGWGASGDCTEKGRTWNPKFWEAVGLPELVANDFAKIGRKVRLPGERIGTLAEDVARELGLSTSCVVAAPMIDAHCGAIGVLGVSGSDVAEEFSMEQRVAMACGTSTCHIALSKAPILVNGVWGPFPSAVLPDRFCTEGGQSVTGKLLEHLVQAHPAYPALCARVGEDGVYDELAGMTEDSLEIDNVDPAQHVHVLDFFCGSRSPYADPSLRGVVSGLGISDTEDDLAILYRATTQALCYGARLILERMNLAGHDIRVILACGGLTRSNFFNQELADICKLPVLLPQEPDATLLGGAILASTAAATVCRGTDSRYSAKEIEAHSALLQVQMTKMSAVGAGFLPRRHRERFHDKKYAVYIEMYKDFLKYRNIMECS